MISKYSTKSRETSDIKQSPDLNLKTQKYVSLAVILVYQASKQAGKTSSLIASEENTIGQFSLGTAFRAAQIVFINKPVCSQRHTIASAVSWSTCDSSNVQLGFALGTAIVEQWKFKVNCRFRLHAACGAEVHALLLFSCG